MRPTLFYIPHEIFGIPFLGFGWVLGAIIATAIAISMTSGRKQGVSKVLQDQGVTWIVGALVVVFLLPQIETRIDDGTANGWNAGLPIRGYGLMLMFAVVSGVGIAMHQCKKWGMSQDAFFSLATWEVVAGLLGARIFYVVQKWNELSGETITEKIWTAFKVTEGGLVVYGSVIGGLIAAIVWCRINRQPILRIADAIAPAFFIGLFFGRLGCLLNGCCYGGICESHFPSIRFPSGSPAYMDQLRSGKLLGMSTEHEPSPDKPQRIQKVLEKSWAGSNAIRSGQTLVEVRDVTVGGPIPLQPLARPIFEAFVNVDGRKIVADTTEIPSSSLPVHPSQVYAAISGLLLCAWTFFLSRQVRRPGIVFGAGLVAYGFFRIAEEIIRVDEAGQFGTSLSIAQWISLCGIGIGMVVIVIACLQPKNTPSAVA